MLLMYCLVSYDSHHQHRPHWKKVIASIAPTLFFVWLSEHPFKSNGDANDAQQSGTPENAWHSSCRRLILLTHRHGSDWIGRPTEASKSEPQSGFREAKSGPSFLLEDHQDHSPMLTSQSSGHFYHVALNPTVHCQGTSVFHLGTSSRTGICSFPGVARLGDRPSFIGLTPLRWVLLTACTLPLLSLILISTSSGIRKRSCYWTVWCIEVVKPSLPLIIEHGGRELPRKANLL